MSKHRYSAWQRFREILKSRGELEQNPFIRDVDARPDDVESETEDMRDDTPELQPEAVQEAVETMTPAADAVPQALSPEEEGDTPEATVQEDAQQQEASVEEPVGEEEQPCIGVEEALSGDESDGAETEAKGLGHVANPPAPLTVDGSEDPMEASRVATASVSSADEASISPREDAATLHFGKAPLESARGEVDAAPMDTAPMDTAPMDTAPIDTERRETEPKQKVVAAGGERSEEESDSFVKEVMSELDDSTFLIVSDGAAASSADGDSAKEGMSLAAAALPLWQDLEHEEESVLRELRSLQDRRRQLVESFLDALRDGEARLGEVRNRLSKARQDSNQAQQRTWLTSQQLQAANDRIRKLEAQLTDVGSADNEVQDLRQAVSDREQEVTELARTSDQLAHDLEAAKSRLEGERIEARRQLEAVLRRVAELESATTESTEVEAGIERPTNGLGVQEVVADRSEASGKPFKPMILEGGVAAERKEGDLALQNLREELQDLG